MGRFVLNWVCVLALVALPVGGCSDETAATGGSGGSGGTGGDGAPACTNGGGVCLLPGSLGYAGICENGRCRTYDCDSDDDCGSSTLPRCNEPFFCDVDLGACAQGDLKPAGTRCVFEDLEDFGICTDDGACVGTGGDGGTGGTGGADPCERITCGPDTECRIDGVCNASARLCDYTLVADGTACTNGECLDGVCAPFGVSCEGTVCPCTEAGILDAIAQGGGPYTFSCDGPTTVVTEGEIVIDNDVILDGEGRLTVDGDEDHTVFSVTEGVTAELRGVGATGGRIAGISNAGTLVVTDSTISENGGPVTALGLEGKGIINSGDLLVERSAITDNTTNGSCGAGIWNEGVLRVVDSSISGNSANEAAFYGLAGSGAGICNRGTATLTNTTVSMNSTENTYGQYVPPDSGGGIHNEGALTLLNSTVSMNSAGRGGGIHHRGGMTTLIGSTLRGNVAFTERGGGIYAASSGTTLANTLVAGDCDGDVFSTDYNIESPGDTCGFDQPTDQVNVTPDDLKLGPLQDNGGPTMTHALGAGSVAIDHIPAVDCEVDEDQRGEPRPGGTMCDVGAFEVQEGSL